MHMSTSPAAPPKPGPLHRHTHQTNRRIIVVEDEILLVMFVECVNTGVALEQGRASDSMSYQFRVPSTVDAGFMNMRSKPSMAAPVVATVPAGERGLQKVGECRPSEDPIVKSPWCYMQWHGMTGE